MINLKGQIAFITGGAKGIGKGIVKVLSEMGATVIIGDIDQKCGESTAKEFNGDYYEMDVTKKDQVAAVVSEIIEKHKRIDILCSNTGVYPQAMLEDMREEDWDLMQNINIKGMFFVVQAVVGYMKQQEYGRIILTSSITGPITGYPGWAHYGASKAGQLGFMKSAALEYAKYNITINAVQPGNILTEGLKDQGENYIKEMESIIPSHTLGEPEDIGYAAAFFASKEAKFITGQAIVVDGGQILPESPDAII
ncbi:MAG: 3-oxoacyl-ACP reductase FabG [Gallicola sp.]|nr:3-oxoacyl-ACP reductase FabG [Gallicola sp.]